VLVQRSGGKIPQGMAFSPDGWRLATANGVTRTVRVFDLRNPSAAPMLLEGHQEIVDVLSSVDFSPDGTRLAAGGGGKTVRVWDLRSPEALPVLFEGPQASVKWIKFSLDGTQLLSFDRQGRSLLAWPLWTAASDYLCTRVWRNFSMDEWRLYMGEDIPYERTCQALPPGAGAPLSPK
jgi:WD40 repeat protein